MVYVVDSTDESLEKLWVDAEFGALGKPNSSETIRGSHLSSPGGSLQPAAMATTPESADQDVKGGRG